jgi:hypothetical protein
MSPKYARDVAVGMGRWAADLGEEVAGCGIGAAAISPLPLALAPSAASILNSLGVCLEKQRIGNSTIKSRVSWTYLGFVLSP